MGLNVRTSSPAPALPSPSSHKKSPSSRGVRRAPISVLARVPRPPSPYSYPANHRASSEAPQPPTARTPCTGQERWCGWLCFADVNRGRALSSPLWAQSSLFCTLSLSLQNSLQSHDQSKTGQQLDERSASIHSVVPLHQLHKLHHQQQDNPLSPVSSSPSARSPCMLLNPVLR